MRRVGFVGVLIGLFFVGSLVWGNDRDPAILLAIGPDSPQHDEATELLDRDIVSRQSIGHDGRFFFFQALDPLYLSENHYAHQLDFQVYRGQRMFYPLVAGLGGLAPPVAVPWLMAVVQVLAYGVGTTATARVAQQQGGSPWWGLAFALNIGLLMAVLIGGAGVVALASAMAGTALVGDRRPKSAGVAFAASVLTREVMLLYVAGVVLYEWYRTRRLPFVLGAIPGVSFVAWYAYISIRLENTALLFESNGSTGMPFVGIVRAAPHWQGDFEDLSTVGVTFVACALLIRLLFRRPNHLIAGSVGFVVLALLLSELVWQRAFDISRAMTPVYTAFIVATFAVGRSGTDDELEVAGEFEVVDGEKAASRSGRRVGIGRQRSAV